MVVQEEFNPWVEQVVPLFLFPTGEAPLSIAALRFGTLATGAVHLSSYAFFLSLKNLLIIWNGATWTD